MSFLTLVNRPRLSGEFCLQGSKGFMHSWCDQSYLVVKKKINIGTHFLWPQQQSEDNLYAPSLSQKLSFISFSDQNANDAVNASSAFSATIFLIVRHPFLFLSQMVGNHSFSNQFLHACICLALLCYQMIHLVLSLCNMQANDCDSFPIISATWLHRALERPLLHYPE